MKSKTQAAIETVLPDLAGSRMLVIGAGAVGQATARMARTLGVTTVIANRSQSKLDTILTEMPDVETHLVNARDQLSINRLLQTVSVDHIVLSTGFVQGFTSGSIDLADAMNYIGDRLEPIIAIANWIASTEIKPRSFTVVAGFIGVPTMGNLAWSACGPAIKGLGEHLAVELGPVRVNIVAPGPMPDTPMAQAVAGPGGGVRAMEDALRRQLPIDRTVRSDDCARQVMFVAGDPVATGSMRFVEGGLSLVPGSLLRDLHIEEQAR